MAPDNRSKENTFDNISKISTSLLRVRYDGCNPLQLSNLTFYLSGIYRRYPLSQTTYCPCK